MASSLQQKEWSLFHLASWGIASILTSTALVHKKVDADELTGICGVGFQVCENYFFSLFNDVCIVDWKNLRGLNKFGLSLVLPLGLL